MRGVDKKGKLLSLFKDWLLLKVLMEWAKQC